MEYVNQLIPSFSIWQTFNEMILPLTNSKKTESHVVKLWNVIQNEEFLKQLVYNDNTNQGTEQTVIIKDIYKSFSLWILGRLYYLLGRSDLHTVHHLIIEVHMKILTFLSKDMYDDITREYVKILKMLMCYSKGSKLLLEAFVPNNVDCGLDLSQVFIEIASEDECKNLLRCNMKLLEFIVRKNLKIFNLNDVVNETLDCLVEILKQSTFELKVSAFEMFVNLLQNMVLSENNLNNSLSKKFNMLPLYLEMQLYEIYDKKIIIKEKHLKEFNNVLMVFLSNSSSIPESIECTTRVCIYLISECDNSNNDIVLLDESFKVLSQSCLWNHLPHMDVHFLLKYVNFFKMFQRKVVTDVNNYLYHTRSIQVIDVHNPTISSNFLTLHNLLFILLNNYNCDGSCCLDPILSIIECLISVIVNIKMEVRCFKLQESLNDYNLKFINEDQFVEAFLKCINRHFEHCSITVQTEKILKLLANIPLMLHNKTVDVWMYLILLPFFKRINFNVTNLLIDANLSSDARRYFELVAARLNFSETISIRYATECIKLLGSGLFDYRGSLNDLKTYFFKFLNYCIEEKNLNAITVIADNLSEIISFSPDIDQCTIKNIYALIVNEDHTIREIISAKMMQIFCILANPYVKFIENRNDTIKVTLMCTKCNYRNKFICLRDMFTEYKEKEWHNYAIFGPYENKRNDNFINIIFKAYLQYLNEPHDKSTMLNSVRALKMISNHVPSLYGKDCDLWVNLIGHNDKEVRVAVKDVIRDIFVNAMDNSKLPKEKGQIIADNAFACLLKYVKKSLEASNRELQNTLIGTIKEMCKVKVEYVQFPLMKLLLYFIMIPTSYFNWVAINTFTEMAKLHDSTTLILYKKHQSELCKNIINLSAINLMLINWNLCQSLEKVSLLLQYFDCKDFVNRNIHFVLPYLICLVPTMPKVSELVKEISVIINVELSELLIREYDHIFVQIFLNETDDTFNQCISYIESITRMNATTLKRRTFNKILNELLLNYNEKSERVLQALKLSIKEESGITIITEERVADYLQPKFLGVLKYFDMKLVSRETNRLNVILSLSEIIKLMGPKRVTPLRFKIIAMLTALYFKYCKTFALNCNVWDTFIRTCDIDALGPQLATIFVSLLPLNGTHPKEINSIFRYLLIENEKHLKEYILDLFFVLDYGIDNEILIVIRKYVTDYERNDFKDQLKRFVKYLTHETTDVRIYGFKYLKKLLVRNREELDRMILGYNGIDTVVIELIDILTLGCRVKDVSLKLACGECLGELGAIEPSHLPRRQNEETQTFPFYITDDTFIVNSINELTKALQAEKNTQSMDRFSLAIQETLKSYGISSNENSTRNDLWKSFTDAQQELMNPLLSSRYTMVQTVESVSQYPIYGSSVGNSLQVWINSWIASLITTLSKEKVNLLQACFPSLKEDYRLLMLFMPHVLLHSLIEGNDTDQENAYVEITAILNSFCTKKKLDSKILEIKPLRNINCGNSKRYLTSTSEEQIQCAKVVFILLDFLNRWLKEWEWQKGAAGRKNVNYKKIQIFLSRFCNLQLSKRNYDCGEYSRALLYIEDYFEKNQHDLDNHLDYLAKIYAQLGEADGVAGVMAIRQKEPTLQERILALEVSGKLVDAVSCYERMPHPMSTNHLNGFIQCILDLDNVNTAYDLARKNDLFELQAEALWRLGKYDDLDDLLERPEMQKNYSWGVQMGHTLMNFRNGKRDEFRSTLKELKMQQIQLFGSSSLEEGAYQHGYSCIARLHSLNELEQIENVTYEMLAYSNDKVSCEIIMQKLVTELQLRLKVVQQSIKITEPILCLRRVAVEQSKTILNDKLSHCIPLMDSLLGETWLLSAKAARIAGLHQQAYSYTIKAEEYATPCLFIEKAKLHWFRMENCEALTTLKRGLEPYLTNISQYSTGTSSFDTSKLSLEERKLCAKAKLLIATYNAATSNVEAIVNIENYKQAVDMFKECEKSLVLLAQYYDKVFQSFPDEDRDNKTSSKMQLHMINYFGKSLLYGTRYIYQSMPRLLSIWFDYGSRLLDVNVESIRKERKNTLMAMTRCVQLFLERLPTFVFLTCFSQLVSRICHPQKEVYMELKAIIVKVMLSYPQQTLWMLIPIIKSSYTVRAKRCEEILMDSRLKTPDMDKLVSHFKNLAEKLIELCNKPVNDNAMVVSINGLLRSLPRLLKTEGFSEIMIPTQKFRKIILPNPDFKTEQHNPFPNHYAHIIGIKDEMTILQSLQKPRRITFLGSDGQCYIQMLKPKDDLRKDFRLMEFNDIVNQLLCSESESRQRRLNIRLFSVVPLNEECGMIEWLPNLVGLRGILYNVYKQRGQGMSAKELKENGPHLKDAIIKKREIFTNKLLPRHPPVLGDWFKKTFPDVQGWLTARTAYIRTTAVMSIAGYILGLGDRHGENILLDATCGDTVHVDFNCLFNKGESFEWPERVPFRLTHNMATAMGPLGVEGIFRISCACTLRVLRNNIDMLMSIVRPFVYDPLVSWPRSPNSISSHNAERTNEQAVEHIRNIEQRLQGIIKTKGRVSSIPLSVEGQTDNLIEEAMSVDNLCQMYIGWGAYL